MRLPKCLISDIRVDRIAWNTLRTILGCLPFVQEVIRRETRALKENTASLPEHCRVLFFLCSSQGERERVREKERQKDT